MVSREKLVASGILATCTSLACYILISLIIAHTSVVKMPVRANQTESWIDVGNNTTKLALNASFALSNATRPCPTRTPAYLAYLRYLKAVTLSVVGCVGVLIVGCLLFCMLYKNERLLEQLPWRKRARERAEREAALAAEEREREAQLQRAAFITVSDFEHSPQIRNSPGVESLLSVVHDTVLFTPRQDHHRHHRHKPQDDHYLCVPPATLDGVLSHGSAISMRVDEDSLSDVDSLCSDLSEGYIEELHHQHRQRHSTPSDSRYFASSGPDIQSSQLESPPQSGIIPGAHLKTVV